MAIKLPKHLFLASTGELYDVRHGFNCFNRPIREIYSRHFTQIDTGLQLRATLRKGGYAWPGGYPLYFITSDGAALSFDAVRENLHLVLWSIRHKANDGWRVVACEINYEAGDLTCDHCNKRIPSAYGEG